MKLNGRSSIFIVIVHVIRKCVLYLTVTKTQYLLLADGTLLPIVVKDKTSGSGDTTNTGSTVGTTTKYIVRTRTNTQSLGMTALLFVEFSCSISFKRTFKHIPEVFNLKARIHVQ